MPGPSCKPGWRQQWEGPGHVRSTTSWGTSSVSPAAGKVQGYCFLQAVRFMEAAGEARTEDCIGYSTVLDNFLREHEISGNQGEEGQSTNDPSHGPLRP